MSCIYVLKSKVTGKTYTGSSDENEPSRRIVHHNAGKVRSTKAGIPWALVYTERYSNNTEARKRELFLKTGQGRSLLKQIIS